MAVCVHDNITITCTVSSTGILIWTLTELVNNSNISESYTYIDTIPLQMQAVGTLGDFELRLKSSNPLVSTATSYDADPKHNGIVLTCANAITPSLPEQIALTTVFVKG